MFFSFKSRDRNHNLEDHNSKKVSQKILMWEHSESSNQGNSNFIHIKFFLTIVFELWASKVWSRRKNERATACYFEFTSWPWLDRFLRISYSYNLLLWKFRIYVEPEPNSNPNPNLDKKWTFRGNVETKDWARCDHMLRCWDQGHFLVTSWSQRFLKISTVIRNRYYGSRFDSAKYSIRFCSGSTLIRNLHSS